MAKIATVPVTTGDKFVWVENDVSGHILLNMSNVDCVSLSFSKTTKIYTISVLFKNQHIEKFEFTVYAIANETMHKIQEALSRDQMLL